MNSREQRSASSSSVDETIDTSGVRDETQVAGSSILTGDTAVRTDGGDGEQVGVLIGRYRLLQKIGEGGFGSVFMAEQREPVLRQVALKIIKLGMDTRQVIARFAQEQQALARMDHPNVAKVFDAGATEIGRPYFVMELCRGEPITNFCEKRGVPIAERLRLFIQVCHAIQHAHQKGLIHRDIKPSNVLVSDQDGRPHAKVIDFGIAKATDARLGGVSVMTMQEQLIGTPQYMSPEQAEGSLDIDTRTDVYSLGVLLYELLTATTPFDKRSLKSASLIEIQRLIREIDPPRPSERASAAQSGAPAALSRELRGELDWIVMKAIEKDRVRRYESASELAADLQRYLDGRPVMAAPPSTAYRFRKFVKRNRALVIAGAAGAMALLAGAGIATVGFISAILSRDAEAAAKRDAISQKAVADQAREAAVAALRAVEKSRQGEKRQAQLAEEKADEAAAINSFLLDMLGSANLRNLGRDAKVMQALDRAGETVGQSFAGRPKLEGAVRRILAKTYASLGMTTEAEPHITRALELFTSSPGEESVDYAQCLTTLGAVRMQRGDHDESIALYERAVGILMRQAGPQASETISTQSDYANELARVGRKQEAERIFREVIAARRGTELEERRDSVVALNSLAVLLHGLGRLDEAEPLYREAAEIGERVMGEDHPDTLTAKLNMASLMNSRGARAEAEPLLRAGYEKARKVFGENHEKAGNAAAAYGRCLDEQGRIAESIPLFDESLRIERITRNEDAFEIAEAEAALADAHRRAGDASLAVTLQTDAVRIAEKRLGADSDRTLSWRISLSNMLVTANRLDEAEVQFRELMDVCPRVLGEQHPRTLKVLTGYAVLLMRREKYAESVPLLRRSLNAGRAVDGENAADTIITQFNLACALRETDALSEAEGLFMDVVERFQTVFGPRHPNTGTVIAGQAELFWKLKRFEDAERGLRAGIEITKAAKSSAALWQTHLLGRVLLDSGDAVGAEPVLRDAATELLALRGPNHPRTLLAQLFHGRSLVLLGRFDDAAASLLAAHEGLMQSDESIARRGVADAVEALSELFDKWNAVEPSDERSRLAVEWAIRRNELRAN